ncbi:MAG TPA: GPW/gp25 family protein [Longimicrobiaceae bacterium]|nr:GPW/gp25 family protein [Longimicrobiaceae bacterium]
MTGESFGGTAVGWPLLPVPDAAGEVRWPAPDESVRQQVRVILLTRPGEQLNRPLYGAGLGNFLHEPNTLATRRAVRDRIRDSLARWEKRIVTDRIEVWEVPERPTQIRVEIAYRIRSTGAAGQMGLVMELEG